VALSAAGMRRWLASDLSGLDLLVIQIDGIHMDEDLILVAAIGVDANGDKHPLGLIEGATENAATVQALIDNLVERGLDPAVARLFIIDGAKALSKAIRRTFGRAAAIQRCQVHKARNIMERLPKSLHASVRRVLRQAWELDDAELKGSARSFPSVRLRTRCRWQLCTRCGRRRSALEIAIDPFQGFFTVPSHFNSMRRNGAVPNGVGGVFFA
jgi:Transposase, Mutator family